MKTIYLSLHSGPVESLDFQTRNEVTYPGYKRMPFNFDLSSDLNNLAEILSFKPARGMAFAEIPPGFSYDSLDVAFGMDEAGDGRVFCTGAGFQNPMTGGMIPNITQINFSERTLVRAMEVRDALKPHAELLRDAEHYRFIKRHRLVLSGGSTKLGWPIAPFGEECDRYIAQALKQEKGSKQ